MRLKNCVLFFLLAAVAAAQTKAEQPADTRAFMEANALKDPAAKIEALSKFLKQHPDSNMAQPAISSAMNTAAKAWGNDQAKVSGLGDELLAASKGIARAEGARQIASTLLTAGRAEDAERFARIGVDGFTYSEFEKNHQRQAAVLQSQFATARARQIDMLGQVELKLGKDAEARRAFEEVMHADPYTSASARGLATLAAKAGDSAGELQWTIAAFLPHPTKADRDKIDALYRKAHNNSLDGLEAYLDTEYEKLLPNPAHLDPYQGKGKRTVLAELLTGSGCPPCVGMDLAFDALLERYSKADVTVLLYHQNRPKPDPMTFPGSMDRYDYFQARGVPTVAIDGKAQTGGGGHEEAGRYARQYADEIDKALQTEPKATLVLKASRNGRSIPVNVKISGMDAGAAPIKLHIVVAENVVRYSGESGIRFHPMVVRSVVQIAVEGGAAKSIDQTFDLDKIAAELKAYHDAFEKHDDRHNPDGTFRWPDRLEQIDAGRLTVVAFLEEDATKTVLQSASVDLSQGAVRHAE